MGAGNWIAGLLCYAGAFGCGYAFYRLLIYILNSASAGNLLGTLVGLIVAYFCAFWLILGCGAFAVIGTAILAGD